MNFKPNKWKLIIGVILSILLLIFFVSMATCYDSDCNLWSFENVMDRAITSLFLLVLPFFLIFYTIWSLIEKKDTKADSRKT